MNIEQVKQIAISRGIGLANSKIDIIRAIQVSEGYSPCFQTDIFNCKRLNCLWRNDCKIKVHII